MGTTGGQTSPRARLGSPLGPGATISYGWSPSSDFFSCICLALNIIESKTLQRFSPKISVADLKVCKILLCVSLSTLVFFLLFFLFSFVFCYPKVRTWRGHSTFMLKQKVFCVFPRSFPEYFEAVDGLREL